MVTRPTTWIPAAKGDRLQDVDTPALILDLDRFETNLARMRAAAASFQVRLRPHAKSHKCVEIARRQIAAGAIGICCQKVGEAEVFVNAGIGDVLITNEVVGERKLQRLVQLARHHPNARLGVCVDNVQTARRLGALCMAQQARLDVYVDLDVGQNRTGVATPQEAVELARTVVACPRLTFMGLHAYAGNAQHRRGVPERRAAVEAATRKAAETRAALRAADLPCEVITGGGTGTFIYEAGSQIFSEIQPGSYVLMDVDYARNEQDQNAPRFEHALFILATVMSQRGDRATLDAGLKAFSTDAGLPAPTFTGWQVWSVSDEHTVLQRTGDGPSIKLGDKALLVPSHCDPTVNLHEWIVAVRKGAVEAVWPIDARGAFF
ncbi:MAG: DSD1 family PLP-dependent enzyme [Sutterellaceae bacterium]|nr:DSD1 family PLP-dependent enzyme [Burkholderiaceae bacterium]MCX7900978.1 DSD1 family PLP-dependent enzyme [Burkholderiaceae bacterium]MDW8430609.1 DSD1 family PLP-dependent enzyme [Sutterellaceae bacterium]